MKAIHKTVYFYYGDKERIMSEVVRLCRQIELEGEAMRLALYGYATVASHAFIEQKYSTLWKYQKDLERLMGKEEANSIVVQTYVKVMG